MNVHSIMMIVVLCASFLTAINLAHHDWKHKTIPLTSLLIWMALSISYAGMCTTKYNSVFLHRPLHTVTFDSFSIFCGIALLLQVYQTLRRQSMIGTADLIVFVTFSAWLPPEKTPILLLVSGVISIMLTWHIKNNLVPFLPGLFFAWFICLWI